MYIESIYKGNRRQQGSSLLEVMVALVVLGVGLLGFWPCRRAQPNTVKVLIITLRQYF